MQALCYDNHQLAASENPFSREDSLMKLHQYKHGGTVIMDV